MSLKVKVKSAADFPPITEGTYTAICYTIADLGMQYSEKFKKTSHKILFIWEIDDDEQRIDIDGEKKRRAISKQYTASFATKSNMYKDIRPWIGREFTPEEAEGTFDVGTLLGTACLISVINKANEEGNVYSAVSSIMQLPKSIKAGPPENPMVLYDMDESPDEDLEKLPEWVQEKVKKSKNADMDAANSVEIKVDTETGEVISETAKPVTVDDLP